MTITLVPGGRATELHAPELTDASDVVDMSPRGAEVTGYDAKTEEPRV